MAAVDRDVYATTDGARYATAIYGVLDASQRPAHARQRRPSGGAGVAARHRRARCVSTPPGRRLGLIEAGTFRLARCAARRRIACSWQYTDGVSEALDEDDEEFGDERLADVAARQPRSIGRRHLRGASSTRFARHRGSRQDQDDVTVMVVKAIGRA